jgi:hypothetical protein
MKDALILQDKKYISAKRAAVIFGYSSDYVGQLCREGKIECTMVGRSWFVSEESVLSHKLSSVDAKVASDDSVKIVSVPIKQDSLPSSTTESMLAPGITLKDLVADNVVTNSNNDVLAKIELPKQKVIDVVPDNSIITDKSKKIVEVEGSIRLDTDSDKTNNKKIFSRRFNTTDIALVLILLLLSAVLFGRNFISYFPYSSKDIVATVLNGVVVAPSASTSLENESMKSELRNPFSDEVNVLPDSSGTAGVIVPVFKESKGDDFLYVMVPVKETKKDENK